MEAIGNKKLPEPYEDEVSDVFAMIMKLRTAMRSNIAPEQSFRMFEIVGCLRLKASSSLTFSAGIPSSASDVSSDASRLYRLRRHEISFLAHILLCNSFSRYSIPHPDRNVSIALQNCPGLSRNGTCPAFSMVTISFFSAVIPE